MPTASPSDYPSDIDADHPAAMTQKPTVSRGFFVFPIVGIEYCEWNAMPAKIHLLCGPARSGKTNRLWQEYQTANQQRLGSALWLVPTPSLVQQLRQQFCSKHTSVLLAPQIYTPEQLAHQLVQQHYPQLHLISSVQQRLLLEEWIGELYRKGQLSYFAPIVETTGFARSLLGWFAEIKQLGLDTETLRKALYARIRKAQQSGEGRQAKGPECLHIWQEYQQRLKKTYQIDTWDVLPLATECWSQNKRQPFDRIRTLVLDAWDSWTPVQERFLHTLIDDMQSVWISLLDDPNVRSDLFEAPRRLLQKIEGSRIDLQPKQATQPVGLSFLREHLFQSPDPPKATDGSGLRLLEAPGVWGEIRLIARQIVLLLQQGVLQQSIHITARNISTHVDLFQEVFSEYQIPFAIEEAKTLQHNPAVATLLRAIRLPEDDFPFRGVTALLRSNYFQPQWNECVDDPERPRQAEYLLRLLGESKNRDAYLEAVRVWAETPPEGLEDEQAEEPKRLKKIRLARRCRSFLQRFFRCWERFPTSANLSDYLTWIKRFAVDIGLESVAQTDPMDRQALEQLWQECNQWTQRNPARYWNRRLLTRPAFVRFLQSFVAALPLPSPVQDTQRVQILPAEQAQYLDCAYLFVCHLGEGSFPKLSGPESLLDDEDRQRLRQQGFPFSIPEDRLAAEKLLFYRLITRPIKELILSYPAVDEQGQPLLPSSFLQAVQNCFEPNTISVTHQRMLIEGYITQQPLCAAEYRVQVASWLATQKDPPKNHIGSLPVDLQEHLWNALQMADHRFGVRSFGVYDGWLDSPNLQPLLQQRFGPQKIFSPTALEAYVACPFRFFLQHVLRLEELQEPGEEVEQTRRGAAFHRALSRFHRLVKDQQVQESFAIPESSNEQLLQHLDTAIQEYVDRSASSASRMLWKLEGERLKRFAQKYRQHWQTFVEPWKRQNAMPIPHRFEADFGFIQDDSIDPQPPLKIEVDGIEVQIGGRIDRIDIAQLEDELGFWIIDYKTGKGTYYNSTEVSSLQKLQLSLYALAVERVFFGKQQARPLGLAYWLLTDSGPKPVLPARKHLAWLQESEEWHTFRTQLETWVTTLVTRIRRGLFPLAPRSEHCTQTCPYNQICRISQSRSLGKPWDLHDT